MVSMGRYVEVRVLENRFEQNLARQIFDSTWHKDNGTEITANLLQAMIHSGAYLAGAFLSGKCVGASFAFPAKPPLQRLHSHMTAVNETHRDLGIGFALKKHQKIWANNNGYSEVTWTFDPLICKNARFNIIKLGAEIDSYHSNFYGEMSDNINFGDESDRLMACLNTSENDSKENLMIENPNLGDVLIKIPDDIVMLRKANYEESLKIRLTVRERFTEALRHNYKVVGFSKNNEYIFRKFSEV